MGQGSNETEEKGAAFFGFPISNFTLKSFRRSVAVLMYLNLFCGELFTFSHLEWGHGGIYR